MAERDIIARLIVEGANQFVQETQKAATAEEQLNQAITENTQVQDQNAKKTISARQELKNLREELIQLARQGKVNTEEYKRLRDQAGQLSDAIGDASAEIKQAGSDTRGLDKALRAATVLTGAFTAVQGATALFGKESENLQKSLLKVQGALAILNGLQEIQTELSKTDNILTGALTKAKLAYAAAIGTATGATKAFRLALISIGIGAVVIAIGFLVENWEKLAKAIGIASDEQEKANKVLEQANRLADIQNKQFEVELRIRKALGESEANLLKLKLEQAKATLAQAKSQLDLNDGLSEFSLRQQIRNNLISQGITNQEELNRETERLIKIQRSSITATQNQSAEYQDLVLQYDTARAVVLELENAILESSKATDKTTKSVNDLSEASKKINPADFLPGVQKVVQDDTIGTITKEIEELIVLFSTLEDSDPLKGIVQETILEQQRLLERLKKEYEALRQAFQADEALGPEIPDFAKDAANQAKKTAESIGSIFGAIPAKVNEIREKENQKEEEQRNFRIQAAQQTGNAVFDIVRQSQAAQQQVLENRLKQGLITEEEYNEEVAKLRRKEAIAAKTQAIFQATINLASAISAALAKGANVVLAGIVAGLAAAQLAAIIATPIPKFFKGVKNFMGGLAWVGDGGKREPITSSSGELLGVSPDKPTLVNLPKGANVYKDIPTFKKEANIAYLPTPSLSLPTLKENKQLKSLERAMKKNGQKLEDLIQLSRQGNVNTRQTVNGVKALKVKDRGYYV
jgi:hypothetical protein